MNIDEIETLDSNNYEIDLDNIKIPSVVTDSQKQDPLNDDKNITTEINISFERDNENKELSDESISDMRVSENQNGESYQS